jgi:hypothetical protein
MFLWTNHFTATRQAGVVFESIPAASHLTAPPGDLEGRVQTRLDRGTSRIRMQTKTERLKLRIVGLDCVSCSRVIQRALEGVTGV